MIQSLLPSIVVLGGAALFALFLALNRRSVPGNAKARISASRALALATAMQAVHFTEEAITGFHERLGPALGLPGMPYSVFMVFNLAWLGIWLAAIPGVSRGAPVAFFTAWFLAIAGMVNGVAHPLLALAAGGYFPGLVSSPFMAIAGIWLWRQLMLATDRCEGQA